MLHQTDATRSRLRLRSAQVCPVTVLLCCLLPRLVVVVAGTWIAIPIRLSRASVATQIVDGAKDGATMLDNLEGSAFT